MKLRPINFIFLLLIIAVLFSCKNNQYKVRTSSINVSVEINRLEKDMFTLDPEEIPGKVPDLKRKYGVFLELFSNVINTGDIDDPSFSDFLIRFCTDRQNNEVYQTTMRVFPVLDDVKKGLEDAFRHYLYYFPGERLPSVYSCITGFNASILTISGDSVLGIGLDRYLGSDCEYYKQLGIYSYLSARMAPPYIVPDCIYGWATSVWDFEYIRYPEENVLSQMIHEGKLKYFERCMLPETPENIIFGFTPDQMKFCRNNESMMWLYLIENDLIFKTEQFIRMKLLGEAPFTSYFTNESPGKAAAWIGFRIIESYMMKNPGTRLDALMKDVDIQGILEKARYNPQ